MRQGIIKIGDAELNVVASGATPVKLKTFCGIDIMDILDRMDTVNDLIEGLTAKDENGNPLGPVLNEKELAEEAEDIKQKFNISNSLMISVAKNLVYVMACDAKKVVPSQKGYIAFLEEYDSMVLELAVQDILTFYTNQGSSDVTPKNADAVPPAE
jgi:hypothetical protein